MRQKTRAKYGTISKMILKLIAAGALTSLSGLSGNPLKVSGALSGLQDYSAQQLKRCLIHLRMLNYVKYSAEDDLSPLVITKKGLERLNAKSVKDRMVGTVEKRWDHLWRLVAFDVPERKKNARDLFQRELIRLGFFPYQKSMYVTPFPCEKEICLLAQKKGILKYVLVSVTPNLGWRESYAVQWFMDDIRMA